MEDRLSQFTDVVIRHILIALLGVLTSAPSWSQSAGGTDVLWREAKAGFNARTFYLDAEDRSKPPAVTEKEAWAIGGKLYGVTGWWADALQFGASYYLSAPLFAPEDKDGTGLLAPGQDAISVIGEAFARLKFGDTAVTAGRQELDMAYPRAPGVRSSRSDVTYVGKQDSRMVPITYEAVLLSGSVPQTLNYYVSWVDKVKPRNLSTFQSAGSAFGATASDADMWSGGVQFSPAKELWLQAWYHRIADVIRIGWLDGDWVMRFPGSSYLRLAGQYADQRSDGAALLTGKQFSTSNFQAYAEYGISPWTIYSAYSRTGSGADIRNPFTSGPIYTQQVIRTFVRAHETAWQLGLGVDFSAWAPGVSTYADVTRGTGAINPTSGAGLPNATEYDIGAIWVYKSKGSFFDGLRSRIRWAWVIDNISSGDQRSTDLRIDINLPISLL
jgi:hypothetical protein